MIIKDNVDILGMKTTSGSLSMVNCTPSQNAFIIQKLSEAGVIPLAKVFLLKSY
jgi:amidase